MPPFSASAPVMTRTHTPQVRVGEVDLTLDQALDWAQALQCEGKLTEAAALYQHILQAVPQCAVAWDWFGMIACRRGESETAVACLERAIALEPEEALHYDRLGLIFSVMGGQDSRLLERAVACHQQAIRLQPDFIDAHYNLAGVLRALNRLEAAVVHYRETLRCSPGFATAHYELGNLLWSLGRLAEAEDCYRQTLALEPTHADAANHLGAIAWAQHRVEEAFSWYGMALALRPDCTEARYNLGIAWAEQANDIAAAECFQQVLEVDPLFAPAHYQMSRLQHRRGQLQEALDSHQQAVALRPTDAQWLNEYGLLLSELDRLDPAVTAYRQALALQPAAAGLHSNLGMALEKQGQFSAAMACYRQALTLDAGLVAAHSNLGMVLAKLGRADEADVCFRQALDLQPDSVNIYNNWVFNASYLPDQDLAHILARHQAFTERFETPLAANRQPCANSPDPQRRLRIGYVSADFRHHAVSQFLESVLSAQDHQNFEWFAYLNQQQGDSQTRRLLSLFDHWRTVWASSDEQLAALIRDDAIDILVDLSGHTQGNRLLVFARKPAPVQVAWLGYFATTGLTTLDYILADRWVIPPEEDAFYTERSYRLPDSCLCFTPPEFDLPVAPTPAQRQGFITFGSFNNLAKLNDAVMACWTAILHALPGSRLLLKTAVLGDAEVRAALVERFARYGIGAERLCLEGVETIRAALARYHEIDIALDSFPYGGGATTAQALWMGVPVLTLHGDRFIGRLGESLLRTVGLPEWVVKDRDDYVAKAVAFAADVAALDTLRQTVRARLLTSPVCNAPNFARGLEAAYRQMWEAWCAENGQSSTESFLEDQS
ncbi:tetratricopeptide repeat protein [Candidatus Contendibacter odensensis]|uniref:protein O-GlcNAc transferase n=1 Tax=Candidatus Contendobacter odensis Run_B_J11 TaxID=1400861 RepID=A0A7U7J3B7_9GAMM|nr:tetratricopeptide repeat protein [Candidatus Contendobacter odensis]CDH44154.1 putative Tetratricopeptide TPR_2 repeat protein [Candidatus Contendobacter odensis Run_B_J11]